MHSDGLPPLDGHHRELHGLQHLPGRRVGLSGGPSRFSSFFLRFGFPPFERMTWGPPKMVGDCPFGFPPKITPFDWMTWGPPNERGFLSAPPKKQTPEGVEAGKKDGPRIGGKAYRKGREA